MRVMLKETDIFRKQLVAEQKLIIDRQNKITMKQQDNKNNLYRIVLLLTSKSHKQLKLWSISMLSIIEFIFIRQHYCTAE